MPNHYRPLRHCWDFGFCPFSLTGSLSLVPQCWTWFWVPTPVLCCWALVLAFQGFEPPALALHGLQATWPLFLPLLGYGSTPSQVSGPLALALPLTGLWSGPLGLRL